MKTVQLRDSTPGRSQVRFQGECVASLEHDQSHYQLYQSANDEWIGHIQHATPNSAHTERLDDERDMALFFGLRVCFELCYSLKTSPIRCNEQKEGVPA